MWFFSTIIFLIIIICGVAGIVNAFAVRREFNTHNEQEKYHAGIRTESGERIIKK